MNIVGMNYLCVIKEAQDLGKLYGAHIYKVTEAKLYPFFVGLLCFLRMINSYLIDKCSALSQLLLRST